jgi:hypothetical protein
VNWLLSGPSESNPSDFKWLARVYPAEEQPDTFQFQFEFDRDADQVVLWGKPSDNPASVVSIDEPPIASMDNVGFEAITLASAPARQSMRFEVTVGVDDLVLLYIDGDPVLELSCPEDATEHCSDAKDVELSEGTHGLNLVWLDKGGEAHIEFTAGLSESPASQGKP